MEKKISLGLENLILNPPATLDGKRLGLLCNPASVDSELNHAVDLIHHHFPGQLCAIFSPQHGFYAEKQDNMIESAHAVEPRLNIPVYSLYSKTRIPTPDMFESIDILLVDIQDVGTRVYTFIYTVSYCMEIAGQCNKKVIILDRPNPIGGSQVEGNILSDEYASFVGRFPIPMRHGMTMGEICGFFNREFHLGCDLDIIPMSGWQRKMYWQDFNRDWVPPSPNLPTPDACTVYPGQVIFEGTNISEGRGTTLPFLQFGAPFMDIDKIKDLVQPQIKGAVLRPVRFEPTSGKWQGKGCRGFHIHVTQKEHFQPYVTSLLLMQGIVKYHPDEFKFKQPPYEYEYRKMPMDLILGSKTLREEIMKLTDIKRLSSQWEKPLAQFKQLSKPYYLYE